jgi:hypothetical protein
MKFLATPDGSHVGSCILVRCNGGISVSRNLSFAFVRVDVFDLSLGIGV